jgi:hypothetical protein
MNSAFVTLSDEQLARVAGGENVSQSASATATSSQTATSTNTNVAATNSAVGNIAQLAFNTAVAENLNRSFNRSLNSR